MTNGKSSFCCLPELQHPQARAVLRADAEGCMRFRTVLPVAYPVPSDGPVGKMLLATGRDPWRPAHIHFMVVATGWRSLLGFGCRLRCPLIADWPI